MMMNDIPENILAAATEAVEYSEDPCPHNRAAHLSESCSRCLAIAVLEAVMPMIHEAGVQAGIRAGREAAARAIEACSRDVYGTETYFMIMAEAAYIARGEDR
jgi:hypothetical protein